MAESSPLLVYSYAKCSTCRAAADWLRAEKISFVEKPIYTEPPSFSELREMLAFQNGNLRRLFNTSGIQYRERALSEKLPSITEAEALKLLEGDGRLVRRPFVLGKNFGLIGFDKALWAKTLQK